MNINNLKNKINKWAAVILTVALCCLNAGCSVEEFMESETADVIARVIDGGIWQEDNDIELPPKISVNDIPVVDLSIPSSTPVEAISPNGISDVFDNTEAMSEKEIMMATTGIGRYSYSQISEEEKVLYKEIYTVLANHAEEILISSTRADEVDEIFKLVLNDHPELFFVTGYTMNNYSVGDDVKYIYFSGTYDKTVDEIKALLPVIVAYEERVFDGIDQGMSDYEKARYIYEYIVEHTEYKLNSPDDQNIISVMAYGRSVCQGYAKTTQYLLNDLGIPCLLVLGEVNNTGEGHAWNMAYLDGEWCYIDTTWGDASYRTNAPEAEPGINYDYLGVTYKMISKTHKAMSSIELPICSSEKNFYYVKEGSYFKTFTGSDTERLGALFEKAYEKQQDRIVVKCENDGVYVEMLHYLIDENHIFDYMKAKEDGVHYAKISEANSLVFYL